MIIIVTNLAWEPVSQDVYPWLHSNSIRCPETGVTHNLFSLAHLVLRLSQDVCLRKGSGGTLSTLLLLLLSRFSRVRLCVTPQTAAHQAPPSLGFSRQEHWSGLPFPSPMHESEKWKWSRSVLSDPSRPHGLQPTRLLRSWDFPGKSTGVGCHCLLHYNFEVFFYPLLAASWEVHKVPLS